MHRSKRGYPSPDVILLSVQIRDDLLGLIGRTAIHIQNRNAITNEILLIAIFNCLDSLRDRRGVVVRGDRHEQIRFADAHELAK